MAALNLPGGLLVYTQGEATPKNYVVRHSGKRLEVAALDLSGTLEDVLRRVKRLADRVIALRAEAREWRALLARGLHPIEDCAKSRLCAQTRLAASSRV